MRYNQGNAFGNCLYNVEIGTAVTHVGYMCKTTLNFSLVLCVARTILGCDQQKKLSLSLHMTMNGELHIQ